MTISSAYQVAQRAKHEPPEGWPASGLPDDARNILAASASTRPADNLPVTWTVWPHVREPHGATRTGTWREWTLWLTGQLGARYASKMKCPGWALASFTKGYRVDHETHAIFALVLDCDDRGDWDRTLATLADLGIAYLAYRSPTHGACGACKWRLVVPLTEPLTDLERWPSLYNAARVILGGVGWTWFDPSCANPSRLWFVGIVGDGEPREVIEREGVALDIGRLTALFDAVVAQAPASRPPLALVHGPGDGRSPLARAERWLHAVEGAVQGSGGDAATFRVAAKLVRDFDLSDSDALSLLERWNSRCVPPWTTAELGKKIANARKYGSHSEGEALDQRPPSRAERVTTMGDAPPDPPQFVAVLMAKNTRVAAHWRGTGKANGDTSPMGYDWLVACDVIDAGGSFDDAVGALLSRPCAHAWRLGPDYAQKTVERVLQRVPVASAPDDEFVKVESISVQMTSPPIYTLTINGCEIDCNAAVLAARSRFQVVVMEACHFVPVLPPTRGGKYLEWVNGLLARSTKVEMPPDASTAAGERDEIEHMLSGLASGEGRDGLERGCAVSVDESGIEAILMRPLFASVRVAVPQMTRPQLGKCLRALGWVPETVTIAGAPVRVWRGKR